MGYANSSVFSATLPPKTGMKPSNPCLDLRLNKMVNTHAALGTLRGINHEDELARFFILTHHIRFAAGAFHFRERRQLVRSGIHRSRRQSDR